MNTGYRRAREQRVAGLTLVELLIAMALGLLVIEGILQVYMSNRNAYQWVNAHARQQENMRFTVDALAQRIQSAGYEGCAGVNVKVKANLLDSAAYDYDFDTKLFAYTGNGSTFSPSGLPTAITSVADPNSDIITFRGTSEAAAPLRMPYPTASSTQLKVLDIDGLNVAVGDILMITDCINSTVFQTSSVSDTGNELVIQHGTGGTPGNTQSNLGIAYYEGSEVARVVTETYYISAPVWDHDSDASTPNQFVCWGSEPERSMDARTSPGLCRVEMGRPGRRLLDGVERMKLSFGQNTDGDDDLIRAVDRYVSAEDVTSGADWGDVSAVKLGMLFRSGNEIRQSAGPTSFTIAGEAVTVPSDRFMRRAITQTVALRNKLP